MSVVSKRRSFAAFVALTVLGLSVQLFSGVSYAASTYTETVGGNAHTWTDPSNAGGTEGSLIQSGWTVQIACVVQGFRVSDGNTNWYRIDQSPWSNQYYVSADAFYNNGATSGSLQGTPYVDPAVPSCSSLPTGTSETAGGVAHTWTNPANAGGTQGPSVAGGQAVQIGCKLTGFRVADGNTWWYQIGSSPWNNSYFVSADAFYNNGAVSGSLVGTPFVDPAVPDCTGTSGGGGGSKSSPIVHLAQGPAAPYGYRYAISLSGFGAGEIVSIWCFDSVSTSGFYTFRLTTNSSGVASTQIYCFSGDGPDHWAVAGGFASNHVEWGTSSPGSPGTPAGSGNGTSTNPSTPTIGIAHGASWAGYAASGTNFTYVHGQWRVPKVDCSVIGGTTGVNVFPGIMGQWVGIDGYNTNDLLQAGVSSDCVSKNAAPSYTLFWEALPAGIQYSGNLQGRNVGVSPGNTITVDIRYHGTGNTNYNISVRVNGVPRLTQTGRYAAAKFASAECIVEDVQHGGGGVVPYPNYGTATFTSCLAARSGASTGPQIASGSGNGFSVYREIDDLRGMKADVTLPTNGGSTWSVLWRAP